MCGVRSLSGSCQWVPSSLAENTCVIRRPPFAAEVVSQAERSQVDESQVGLLWPCGIALSAVAPAGYSPQRLDMLDWLMLR